MKILHLRWGLGLVVALLAGAGLAQESRIAIVNVQRMTSESVPAKVATAKLEQEFSKRQKDLGDMQVTLKGLGERLEREGPTLNESQRVARQREYADQGREFQRKQREFQEDLTARRNEELQNVLVTINKAVKQVADAEKYDLVFQEAAYSNGKHDITDKVLKVLNAGAK
jgi:outer membrane protein